MADKALPNSVKVENKRLDWIKKEMQNSKNKNEFVVPGGSDDCTNANDSYQLNQDIKNGEITH